MTKLTQEQIETLEYSFSNLDVDFEKVPSAKLHGTMEGVRQQLESGADKVIYSYRNETGGVTITSMKVGEKTEESREALNKVRENVLKYWKDLRKN
jgi:hypothetical protein